MFTYDDRNKESKQGYSINFVKFCPSFYGLKLAACTAKGTLMVFDYRNGRWEENGIRKEEAHANSINSIAWAPPGNGLNDNPNAPVLITGACDRTVRVFDVEEGSSL